MDRRNLSLLAVVCGLGFSDVGLAAAANPFLTHKTDLHCERADSGYIRARMFRQVGESRRDLAIIEGGSPMGHCELARRNARDGKVCLPESWSRVRAYDLTSNTFGERFSSFEDCFSAVNTDELAVREGYVDFIDPRRVQAFKALLPTVEDPRIQQILTSADTMWYDEFSMTFTYQDSQGSPVGLRGNRVGWDVGENASAPISKLRTYFEFEHFRPPFKTAAGTDHVSNKFILNFWSPPKENGKVLPVRYWVEDRHWKWAFPVGTVFGEVLFLQAPDDGSWYVFEIRTRIRHEGGWDPNAFRPFPRASDLSRAIKAKRPEWQSTDLRSLVEHLDDPSTLTRHTLDTGPYREFVQPIEGSLDKLPATRDLALIKSLLRSTPFRSTQGEVWKRNGDLETYAASTDASFSIVPAGYEGGVIAVNEVSCNRCHDATSRMIGDIEGDIVLYGEIWGEDRIFTWHLFQVDEDSFNVSDHSRRANPRLLQAGLIKEGRPETADGRF